MEEDTVEADWGCHQPTEEDGRKEDFMKSDGPTLIRKSRKWRQITIKTWSATENWIRRSVLEDVLERVGWLALLGEEEEELRMSNLEWDSLQRNIKLVGTDCVQNILEKVVHRAFRIVEYRKEKRRKQEVAGNIVEKIVDSIIKRGEKNR